mgnify:CR=1 FL=1
MDIVVVVVAGLAGMLVVAAFAAPLSGFLGAPQPVLLAVAGLAYGAGALHLGVDPLSGALDGYQRWLTDQLSFDSASLLYVFLPPLLFEMALAVQVRRLAEDWVIVLLMAVIAVAAATAAVGLAVWAVTDAALIATLLLGAAVATTDPSAVVTTFRDIGAPRRLLTLLEGESLLNDAAAIAIFTVLLAAVGAGAGGVGGGALATGFLYQFAVGAAVGIAAGVGASRLYPLLGAVAAAEASLTVALAYGVYILADAGLGASGVVAVVAAGAVTGATGFVRMGPGNWRIVREVWSHIGYWCNALILLIASALTPALLAAVDLRTALLIPVVYLAAMAARALLLFGGLPALERLGLAAPLDLPRKLLVLWGGVRGPVTLVLALSLTEVPGLGGDGAEMGALAAGFALMTLLVNAPTLALVTSRLGLDRLSPGDLALRERIVAGSYERLRRVVANLAAEHAMDADAEAEIQARIAEQARDAVRQAEETAGDERISFGERLRLGLTILAAQESRLVRRAFEEGAIGPRATLHLRLTAERLADAARVGGRDGYEAAAERAMGAGRRMAFAVFLQRRLGIDRPLREAMELDFTAQRETGRNLRELDAYAEANLADMIGGDAAENLRALLAERLAQVRAAIEAHEAQYPDYAAAFDRLFVARAALRRERRQLDRLLADGVIGPELHRDLARELARRERALGRPPRLDLALSAGELIERVPLFADLDPRDRRRVVRRLRSRFVTPGETVVARGERGDAMFFVASGALEMRGEGEPVRLVTGDFFGELALLAPTRQRRTDVVSLGYGRLLTLTRRDIRRLARRAPEIEERVRGAARRQLHLGVAESRDAGRPRAELH